MAADFNRDREVVELEFEEAAPINEFQEVGIASKCFPSLFPDTLGDPTIPANLTLESKPSDQDEQ